MLVKKCCNELIGKTTSELTHYLSTLHIELSALDCDFYVLLALCLEHEFSADVFTLLIKPEIKDHIHTQPCDEPIPWLFLSPEDQQTNLQLLSHALLTNCLHTIQLFSSLHAQ
jgi:hypothetical protein